MPEPEAGGPVRIVINNFDDGIVTAISHEDAKITSLADATNTRLGKYGSVKRRLGSTKVETSAVSANELTSCHLMTFATGHTLCFVSDGQTRWYKTVCTSSAFF